ncbi:MAG: class I SAM-dependent methyltransferase [Rhizobacter sp.]
MRAPAAATNYYDGLNLKLLDAIPPTARRVLELGCANGLLGRRFKELHPAAVWWGVDVSADAVAAASQHLDRALQLDLDNADLSVLEGGFDVIVIGDLLEHLRTPERLLGALYDLGTDDARIACCLPNMGHLSVIERLVAGDISYDAAGLLDRTHTRFFTPSSAFKTFLDSGWMPHLKDQYRFKLPQTHFAARILNAAVALGLPAETAEHNLGLYQMILVCEKWPLQSLLRPGPRVPFSVIVPVNRPWQHELNVARSPGLQEVDAEVICVQGADSAAAAYASGAQRASHAWRVMAHQDVYFPTGSGFALAQQLGAVERAGLTGAPIGFAGLEPDPARLGSVRLAGLVIDRTTLFRHPPSAGAVSMDEFAVALHRDSAVAIDPSLGWHLWATDLCLQAEQMAQQPIAQILDVPLFHNSTHAYRLPPEFHDSASVLMDKYPARPRFATLCGELTRTAEASLQRA